jgi:hypothetical protein
MGKGVGAEIGKLEGDGAEGGVGAPGAGEWVGLSVANPSKT